MKNRYLRNMSALSIDENSRLKDFKVCIVGCGGLGGYVIEMLGRLGIGELTVVDFDVFDESNLNRQLLSSEDVLGYSKAEVAKNRIRMVNSEVKVNVIKKALSESNSEDIIKNHHIVVDGLDSIRTRFILQRKCAKLNIPLVHGAIGGWFGQVSTIFPGDNTLDLIYKNMREDQITNELGNPSFTPANIASIQVGEVIKVLLNKGSVLRNKLLTIDLLNNEHYIIEFN